MKNITLYNILSNFYKLKNSRIPKTKTELNNLLLSAFNLGENAGKILNQKNINKIKNINLN